MNLAGVALAWLAYAAIHSALSSHSTKAWVATHWPSLCPWYRLIFNAVAALSLLPVLWLVYATEGQWLWVWRGPWAWLANGLALVAIAGILASSRSYDMDEFLGLRQLREHQEPDRQNFTLSTFHRYVRHPWYSLSLVLVWTRDMNEPLLVSAVAISLYFALGSRLEERKLMARYGEPYRYYMSRVPGLLPRPWRRLSREEARRLVEDPRHA